MATYAPAIVRERRRSLVQTLALALFFASGFAALTYQIIWQRLLVAFSGADVFSVTLIVASFMAGLGIGSAAGGQWRIGLRGVARYWALQ